MCSPASARNLMSSSLLAMGVFTLVGAITPGPVNVLALRHGAARSRLVSAAYVLGASASIMEVSMSPACTPKRCSSGGNSPSTASPRGSWYQLLL